MEPVHCPPSDPADILFAAEWFVGWATSKGASALVSEPVRLGEASTLLFCAANKRISAAGGMVGEFASRTGLGCEPAGMSSQLCAEAEGVVGDRGSGPGPELVPGLVSEPASMEGVGEGGSVLPAKSSRGAGMKLPSMEAVGDGKERPLSIILAGLHIACGRSPACWTPRSPSSWTVHDALHSNSMLPQQKLLCMRACK